MNFSEIKGFGEKRIQLLESAGIHSPADLITYFPVRYVDTKHLSNLATCNEGDRVVILACTQDTPKVARIKKSLSLVKVKFTYDNKTVWCSWFNQPFMAKNIVPQRYYYISGKLKKFKSTYEIVAPQLLAFTGEEPPVIPVYKPIGKISGKLIGEAIKSALKAVKVQGYIPRDIAIKHGVGDINEAFRNIHFPQDIQDVYSGQRVLAIERLSYMLTAFSIIKAREKNEREVFYDNNVIKLKEVANSLPYELTDAQKKSVNALIKGFHSKDRVNCLLEGDVGCGKTIVAFLAMYYATVSGHQAVLMAPTEILARQHFSKAIEFFTPLGITCEFLSSSVTGKERARVISNIKSGQANCVFGTHALLSDEVEFADLSLVITDEQHRFGVAQRANLENKTRGVDSIVMSATPIPRTLALSLYGELDRIVIDELPLKKAQIITRFVPKEKETGMWDYVYERAQKGEQAYVVVPRISDDEDEINSAESVFDSHKKRFGDMLQILHGKQKESVKNATMTAFSKGEVKVLVATTVVEVGIDVPNATTMIIYDSDRFGLSQLHQLRGRVGRGEKTSHCFVLSNSENEETRKRLESFISCSDGFALAEEDFKMRGAGDFLGYSQHGAGQFPSDTDMINLAKSIKESILQDNSATQRIENSITTSKYEYFNGITLN